MKGWNIKGNYDVKKDDDDDCSRLSKTLIGWNVKAASTADRPSVQIHQDWMALHTHTHPSLSTFESVFVCVVVFCICICICIVRVKAMGRIYRCICWPADNTDHTDVWYICINLCICLFYVFVNVFYTCICICIRCIYWL